MIKTLEKSARTEDEAVALALKELGMDRDDVSVEIVERAKSGFLGIGASPAVVRISYEVPDEVVKPAPKAAKPAAPEKAPKTPAPAKGAAAPKDEPAEYAQIRQFLSGLLERMGVSAEMEISPRETAA